MVSESGNTNNPDTNKASGEFSESAGSIEKYSIIALLVLIASVLLISLDQKLIAGCFVLAAAAIGVITFRKKSELDRKFRESTEELRVRIAGQEEMIASFSHKIREPLNNIVIVTDLLIESGVQKKQQDLLETFIASTNNMVTTVNELAMHSAGTISHEQRKAIRFNLISTLENTFDLYSLKDKANLDFILNKKDLHNTEFFGDPIIIKQIFLDVFNIIESQALEKAITVTINLRKVRETGPESIIGFRIQIDRSIVLINEAAVERSLAARLISAGNGNFEQEVGPNHTVLSIFLPLRNPVSEPKQNPVSPTMEELVQKDKTRKNLKDIKVLLVEDNLINQKITLLTLSPFVGCIETASNGKEALDKFGTSNYDLILMDIQMPVMSGLTAAEKIRALESTTNSHVPIIAITANAMIGDKEKCLAVGIDDYIAKPFQPSTLLEKIKKII